MNFLEHIQPQLDEMVNDLFFNGYLPADLTSPLKNKLYWWEDEAYSKAKIYADRDAEMTFVGWLNAVEYLGMDVEIFNDSLIAAIRSTVELQWDIRTREQQEDMKAEIELAVA